ncbi:MAG: glycine cleavage system aminomethyltransferase GcvT [Thermoplasmata archaeon]|nr:MAG: glycine cleavage system aminomethyltransferase GcvT [Thermoplasmata archaeon]
MLKRSPLHDLHVELGAKFTEFSGYEMPLYYSSIKDEHLTVRKNVGLFDVSHMGNVWISGRDGADLLSVATVEDANRIPVGMGQYTVILREDGTIIDDTIFLHLEDGFMLIPNAGRDEIVTDWLRKIRDRFGFDAEIENISGNTAILAIQGPKSREVLQKISSIDLSQLKLFGCCRAEFEGVECIVSRTGYTGELGYELQVDIEKDVHDLFMKILEIGKDCGIKPIGLGARDSLRLEKCFVLAGNEFEGGRTPLEANLSFTINWDHDFIGKDALLRQKEEGVKERLTYLKCVEKGIPRHGYDVEKDGKKVGKVSSGGLSPCLNTGIAMAYVKAEYRKVGDFLDIVIRGKKVKAEIVKPPFVGKECGNI